MPKRKYKKKRGYRGYHPYTLATAPAVGYLAKKAAEKVVKKYLNVEFKHYDLDNATATGNSITTSGSFIHINPIPQGDDDQQRNGAQVRMKKVDINFTVVLNESATVDSSIRIGVLRMINSEGVDPNVNTIYDSNTSTLANIDAINTINRFRQFNEVARLQVVAERRVVIGPSSRQKYQGSFNLPCNHIAKWQEGQSAGDISVQETNAYYFYYIGDVSTNTPTIKYVTRVRYLDN